MKTAVLTILLIGFCFSPHAQSKYTKQVHLKDIERRGIYDIIKLYADEVCIKEIPFLIALHRCFYQDKRLQQGYRLVIKGETIVSLGRKTAALQNMGELEKSLLYNIKSLVLYKKKKNRFKKNLCNFILTLEPGAYEIPKTGGTKIILPRRIIGSIYYNKKVRTNKMTVYLHSGGIKLELPKYAKRISLGILNDMDIGIAELEFIRMNWITRLLYVKTRDLPQRKGWTFNTTQCNKIRAYSE